MASKILLINLVGLTRKVISRMPQLNSLMPIDGSLATLSPPLPAVTCTSQATLLTGTNPDEHGIVSNGWYFRDTGEVRFWLRSDGLVQGEKIWHAARKRFPKASVANLFWRFCTHSDCAITVTERPTYWATGKKSPDVFCHPGNLRDELVEKLGEFPLFRFWGPATSIDSTQWIADATSHVMKSHDPDLTLTYLPHLDYDLQKYGPTSSQAEQAIQQVDKVASDLIRNAKTLGRQVAVVSEYGMTDVSRPVYLNRHLRQAGFVTVQKAQNGELLEPSASRAFVACSHQTAHIYVNRPVDLPSVKKLVESIDGVERVLDVHEMKSAGLGHHRSGELFAIAEPGCWFAYPYWLEDAMAPDFANCVAIHDKPGHDPVEMFLGSGGKFRAMRRLLQSKLGFRVPLDVISTDAGLIRGSHGRLPHHTDDSPVILTDWQLSDSEFHMSDVKQIVLNQMQ